MRKLGVKAAHEAYIRGTIPGARHIWQIAAASRCREYHFPSQQILYDKSYYLRTMYHAGKSTNTTYHKAYAWFLYFSVIPIMYCDAS